MRRAFGIDELECPRYGGKPILLACITQPRVTRAMLGCSTASLSGVVED